MITQDQADNLFEKLATILEVIDENEQAEMYCDYYLENNNDYYKCCNRLCPMVHMDGRCALDEARALVMEVEN